MSSDPLPARHGGRINMLESRQIDLRTEYGGEPPAPTSRLTKMAGFPPFAMPIVRPGMGRVEARVPRRLPRRSVLAR